MTVIPIPFPIGGIQLRSQDITCIHTLLQQYMRESPWLWQTKNGPGPLPSFTKTLAWPKDILLEGNEALLLYYEPALPDLRKV
jgi:hypothetical protein